MGIQSQIKVSTAIVIFFLLCKYWSPINLKEVFIFKSSRAHLPSIFVLPRSVAQLGLKKEKCLLIIFTKNCTSWEIESLSHCICVCAESSLNAICSWSETWDFSQLHLRDHCFIAYLPNIFKTCLCASPSNRVPFWVNYTFDFVLVSLQMPL